jgi:hypothetical protein
VLEDRHTLAKRALTAAVLRNAGVEAELRELLEPLAEAHGRAHRRITDELLAEAGWRYAQWLSLRLREGGGRSEPEGDWPGNEAWDAVLTRLEGQGPVLDAKDMVRAEVDILDAMARRPSPPSPDLRAYHAKHFWNDVGRILVERVPADHINHELRGVGFFGSLVSANVQQAHRLPFAACFYVEMLIDQGLHHHRPEAHARYQAARPLPKFGTFGMGPHIEPPAEFLRQAREYWDLPREALVARLGEAARHFPGWVNEFFAREDVRWTASELFRALGPQDLGELGVVSWGG